VTAVDPAWLDAARKELQGREADPQWPAGDTAAWRTIVALLEHGSVETDTQWPVLVEAAHTAEDRRATLYGEADVADPKRVTIARRLVAIANIRRTLERAARHVGQCRPLLEPAQ